MSRKSSYLALSLGFPLLFLYLQFSGKGLISLSNNQERTICNRDRPIFSNASIDEGCSCPAINTHKEGFPITWTGYDVCGLTDKPAAKNIDIAIGILVEATLLVVATKQTKKSLQARK